MYFSEQQVATGTELHAGESGEGFRPPRVPCGLYSSRHCEDGSRRLLRRPGSTHLRTDRVLSVCKSQSFQGLAKGTPHHGCVTCTPSVPSNLKLQQLMLHHPTTVSLAETLCGQAEPHLPLRHTSHLKKSYRHKPPLPPFLARKTCSAVKTPHGTIKSSLTGPISTPRRSSSSLPKPNTFPEDVSTRE